MINPSLRIDVPFPQNLPVIDDEFDVLDINYDLEADLRDAEIASFHNDDFEFDL